MICKKRRISAMLAFCMLCTILPRAVNAAESTKVMDGADLRQAVANASPGDVLELEGMALVNDTNSDAAPWVIDKEITIKGGTISTRSGGIILGADVTFDGVEVSLANRVRNGIFANGYTLTLKNTTRDSSASQVHVFCGGIQADNNVIGSTVLPTQGNHGVVNITGSNIELGNVYAGSISSNSKPITSNNSNPASISIKVTNSDIGESYTNTNGQLILEGGIYSTGALESPVDNNKWFDTSYEVPAPLVSSSMFPMQGKVNITVSNSEVGNIDCVTGGVTNADINFEGGNNLVSGLKINNANKLTIESGKLELESASELSNTDVELLNGTRLGFTSMGGMPVINDLTSDSGTLVLNKDQLLVIEGIVTGVTNVSIGKNSYNSDTSAEVVQEGHIYITTSQGSSDTAFNLWPDTSGVTTILKNESGNWKAVISENTGSGTENPDGEKPDGEKPDGEKPDGENPNDENPDDANPDDANPDGENPDGENPNDENPDGDNSDDVTDNTTSKKQIKTTGLTYIPNGLRGIFKSIEDIKAKMLTVLTQLNAEFTVLNTKFYNIDLQVSEDNGASWRDATKNDISEKGIKVKIPYPTGTSRHTHDFVVLHMVTEDFSDLGLRKGDIENLIVTEYDNYIEVVFHSFSPMMIAWKESVEYEYFEESTTEDVDEKANTYINVNNNVKSPKTGDDSTSNIVLLISIGMLVLAGIGMYYVVTEK